MVMFQHFHNADFNPCAPNELVFFAFISKVIAINAFHNFLLNRRMDISTIFIDKLFKIIEVFQDFTSFLLG
nr:MAG TPA: hypothetical protein [Caudoviricetes sp.]